MRACLRASTATQLCRPSTVRHCQLRSMPPNPTAPRVHTPREHAPTPPQVSTFLPWLNVAPLAPVDAIFYCLVLPSLCFFGRRRSTFSRKRPCMFPVFFISTLHLEVPPVLPSLRRKPRLHSLDIGLMSGHRNPTFPTSCKGDGWANSCIVSLF